MACIDADSDPSAGATTANSSNRIKRELDTRKERRDDTGLRELRIHSAMVNSLYDPKTWIVCRTYMPCATSCGYACCCAACGALPAATGAIGVAGFPVLPEP